jgi:hypothetical protein
MIFSDQIVSLFGKARVCNIPELHGVDYASCLVVSIFVLKFFKVFLLDQF